MLLSQVICPKCKTMWSLGRGCNCPEHLTHARISKQWDDKIGVCDEIRNQIEKQCSCRPPCYRFMGSCTTANKELCDLYKKHEDECMKLKQAEAAAFSKLHDHARINIYPMLSK